MPKYRTTQGDTWDSISLHCLKEEGRMHLLLEKNPQYNDVVVFPANIVLEIPEMPVMRNSNAPAWRRGGL